MRVVPKKDLGARPARRLARAGAFLALGLLGAAAATLPASEARAQGTTQRPMPNVLLLVDTSGSMERMADSTLPSDNVGVAVGGIPNACSPGVESNPNRWGMLLQALTGNLQPFYSCAAMDRSSAAAGAAFRNEYKINGINPYDTDYFLPYHRPLSGSAASLTTCALGPNRLPGAPPGSGVGSGADGYASGLGADARDFPDDALTSAKWTYMQAQYGANLGLNPLGTNSCIFDQAPDGQLDAARDYVRFSLMTFDNDPSNAIGLTNAWPPQGTLNTTSPFVGEWSYLRDATNPDYSLGTLLNGGADGLPAGCSPPRQPYELGARHYAAPPWEGRMVRFPAADASLLDVQKVNEQIQRVLLATRPYGATPIDGMMDDARDYLWYASGGPKDDPYVSSDCRQQFIILLTDGAPNMNMRPACLGTGGICPYPSTAAQTAAALYADATRQVTTYVIGFSVNGSSSVGGDGFPTGYTAPPNNNCKAWYTGVGGTPTAMATACAAANPQDGTAAAACCALNEIAYAGSGASSDAVGPFFAESQADIVLSFGRILASITKAVSTRTVPTYTPAVYNSTGFNTGATTAQYLASFIPNAAKPWSGEILRDRSMCSGSSVAPVPQTPSVTAGDSEAINLATQGASKRFFVSVLPDTYSSATPVMSPATSTVIDAQRSVRPFVATPADGVAKYQGVEVTATDWGLKDASNGTATMRLAMQIDKTTCRRGRTASGSGTGTLPIPALDTDSGEACTDVIWGFTAAHVGAISKSGHVTSGTIGSYDFNIRCPTSGSSPASGKCSITGDACTVSNPTECATVAGQVCVPDCAPLGAIFRANPVVNGPPDALLRDEGYRAFQARRARRKPTLFAATTDGILHAFKALETATNADHELWSFIPPAVLPRLASNYPSGNQILLDGSPVVKDSVWERGLSDLDSGGTSTPGAKWHTTLVAGLGANGGGYYAVNVTDSDCNADASSSSGECRTVAGSSGYESPSAYSLDEAGAGDYDSQGTRAKRGPHFLWQLTDIAKNGINDPAKVVRRTIDGTDMVGLFGRNTGTPAIATVQLKINGADRQVGVAILPGGIDGTPVSGGSCARTVTNPDLSHDAAIGYRSSVRQWAPACSTSTSTVTANAAVPGRGVTIVRLDTGEVIRHFGRRDDVPEAIWNAGKVNATPFDSPMVGTPVVYPQTTGAIAQKIFIGDADGTLWRIDVTDTNEANWKATLFADLIPTSGGVAGSQPIQVTPVLSLEPSGSLVINAATGDQENVVFRTGEKNYVWSIMEKRPTDTTIARAQTNWRETLDDGERVTGPMTVFDRTLYFASFAPKVPAAGACDNAGTARLWGLSYFVNDGQGSPAGALPMWCGSVASNGVCNSNSLTKYEDVTGTNAGYLIPGVTLRATQACSAIGDLGDGTGTGFTSITPSEFQLTYGVGKVRSASGFPPSATTAYRTRPLPRVAATVNAWALVID